MAVRLLGPADLDERLLLEQLIEMREGAVRDRFLAEQVQEQVDALGELIGGG